MSYVYWQSEPTLWTVGYIAPGGCGPNRDQHPESDHGNPAEAAARVRWLNGGRDDERVRAEVAEEIACAIENADTSGWPGGRGSDVDGCQERAARIGRQHAKEQR